MTQKGKRLDRLMSRGSEKSFSFDDLVSAIQAAGYQLERQPGTSHRIFSHPDPRLDPLNLQPTKDGKAKPYQVRQAREQIAKLE